MNSLPVQPELIPESAIEFHLVGELIQNETPDNVRRDREERAAKESAREQDQLQSKLFTDPAAPGN